MAAIKPNSIRVPLPVPLFEQPYQSGITDPVWPDSPPDKNQLAAVRSDIQQRISEGRIEEIPDGQLNDDALAERYSAEYAGRVSRQKCMSIMRTDIQAQNKTELKNILELITAFSIEEMKALPSHRHTRLLEDIPDTYRVAITLGFGASLFVDKTGFDRFGLRAKRPKFLKPMPSFPGDAEEFDPAKSGSDLILLVSSDHPYINIAVIRFFAEFFNQRYDEKFRNGKAGPPMLKFLDIEEGFSRKDKREFLKFDDGINNINMSQDDLRRLVYVTEADHEPDWCQSGTYMVYRKIRENMPRWEALEGQVQEQMIGRDKETGKPLSRNAEGPENMTPVYPNPLDERDGRLDSHIRKVQPRRPVEDLFGINDKERRFLRRPYPFFDGLDDAGHSVNGLQFVAFMKSLQQQFEHVVNMWQMNPDFPQVGTGVDALFAKGILSTIDGGYYFCPPGLKGPNDYFGSGLFST
ncbi:Dyp-type peroxidase [uncultured Ruegeria sp.]|uniref:Dyp-type peroxidase n=1 Tax=uncultured Ruegeria sp. TaxID=259304 RepID=UPI00262EB7AD|nr:Dyp-type peroxidase [uncultured Ruegeria sp.]